MSEGGRHMRTIAGNHPRVEGLDRGLTDRKTREHGVFEGLGWMVGSISLLFLFSAGLEFFVRQGVRQVSVATFLLALSLASWSFVLGLGVWLVFVVWWFVKWRHGRVKRQVMSRPSFAGSQSLQLETSKLRDPQSPQWGTAPSVPHHSAEASEDGHETHNLPRVA